MPSKQHARCRVLGCINQRKHPPSKTGLFLVPSSASREVFEKWVQLTGNEELCELPVDHLRRNLRICERHFLPHQVSPPTSKLKRLLKRGIATVVPTRFSDDHVSIKSERIDQWRKSEHYLKAIWNNPSQPSDPKCNQSEASDFSSDEVSTGMQEMTSSESLPGVARIDAIGENVVDVSKITSKTLSPIKDKELYADHPDTTVFENRKNDAGGSSIDGREASKARAAPKCQESRNQFEEQIGKARITCPTATCPTNESANSDLEHQPELARFQSKLQLESHVKSVHQTIPEQLLNFATVIKNQLEDFKKELTELKTDVNNFSKTTIVRHDRVMERLNHLNNTVESIGPFTDPLCRVRPSNGAPVHYSSFRQ